MRPAQTSLGKMFSIASIFMLSTPAAEAQDSSATELRLMSTPEYNQQFGRPPDVERARPIPPGSHIKRSPGTSNSPMAPPVSWHQVHWDFSDRWHHDLPVRLGDDHLGYRHYSGKHNLHSRNPVAVAINGQRPIRSIGDRREYQSVLTDRRGWKYATIRVITWDNAVTQDGVYRTPGGRPIGVITAYCEQAPGNRCPDEVNQ